MTSFLEEEPFNLFLCAVTLLDLPHLEVDGEDSEGMVSSTDFDDFRLLVLSLDFRLASLPCGHIVATHAKLL